MKNWKKSWLNELDSITPKLSDEVKSAPIPARDGNVINDSGVAVKRRYNSKALIVAAAAILLCLAIVGTVLLVPKKPSAGVFTVEINPAVSLVTDGDLVTGVMAVNEDADVVLSVSEVRENIVGKKIDEAVIYYVDCAAKLGYLDFSNDGSAVRVSGCKDFGSDKLLDGINGALQNYFTHKGVYAVAITESVDFAEYKARSGFAQGDSLADIIGTVGGGKTLSLERSAENKSAEQLQLSYKQLIGDYDEFMLVQVKDNVNKIVESAADVRALRRLNEEIEQSADNPSFLLKDYWSVKSYYAVAAYTREFSALMDEMETALTEYKNNYGVEFADKWAVIAADTKLDRLPVPLEELQEWLDGLTAGIIEKFSALLSDIMEIAGVLDEGIGELMKLPSNVTEFVAKSTEILQRDFNKRIDEYKATYEQVRQEIAADDYASYLNGIAERYGSLGEYWNATR